MMMMMMMMMMAEVVFGGERVGDGTKTARQRWDAPGRNGRAERLEAGEVVRAAQAMADSEGSCSTATISCTATMLGVREGGSRDEA